MVVKKSTAKITKKATPKVTKTQVKTKIKLPPGKGPHPLYGRPIDEITKFGSLSQMRTMAKTARSHIKEVSAALSRLEARIKAGGK